MKLDAVLLQRAESKCELCKSETDFNLYEVKPDDMRHPKRTSY